MKEGFLNRHLGNDAEDRRKMLHAIGFTDMEELIAKTVPADILLRRQLNLPDGVGEASALLELRQIMARNVCARAMIGQGYHGCYVPAVIQRNLLENPGWYTSYTPYQPEISQGRLEMLFHFQTLVSELTGLPIANASLLDEATAVAEAIGMAWRYHRGKRKRMVVASNLHPQSLDVIRTRAYTTGYHLDDGAVGADTAAVVIQYPDTIGRLDYCYHIVGQAREHKALVIVAADPLALVLTGHPQGADIVVGSAQRFGVPLGNGGPHAAYMAAREDLVRLVPGRIIGRSIDKARRPAYRLALQTREQHIRREKATSNICTAQALLANMAASFAIWHGPQGLHDIAMRIHQLATRFSASLEAGGFRLAVDSFFDTVTLHSGGKSAYWRQKAEESGYLIRAVDDDLLSVAFDQTTTANDVRELCRLFAVAPVAKETVCLPEQRRDLSGFMTQDVFHCYRSETEMMRLLRRLVDRDLALDRCMIPLGSCTMKLNAAAEMMPVSWDETANIHPFAPAHHRLGYEQIVKDLDSWLSELAGFAHVCLQPNAGSQGEYAGLLAIRRFHEARNEARRCVCLIPSSAHGTNPASAQMAGYRVVIVSCADNGDVDLDDLRVKAKRHSHELAVLMITYPSTHGVFESSIQTICRIIHDHGGQVYVDGANLNALVGISRPGDFGADVCHLNLHKTFCIPHGGGGPGIGPIGLASHLLPYAPGHIGFGTDHAVSAAPFGSASILLISWMYLRMVGGDGLRKTAEAAILSANYVARRLHDHYPVLYTNNNGMVAHECILDPRPFKVSSGVGGEDIAKRLMDFGFHAPTMSWPVIGTLMVEPTESESMAELDRFVAAMITIRDEIRAIEQGQWSKEDNPLVNAPHTHQDLLVGEWQHPYSREQAAYPASTDPANKYWPAVARVDNSYGDLNLVCSCPPVASYDE